MRKHFSKIILNLNQWFRRRSHLNIFRIYSSGGLFQLMEQAHLCLVGSGLYEEHFCEIILNLD